MKKSPFRPPSGHPTAHGGRGQLTRILRTLPIDAIDNRSVAGVAIRRIRDDLVAQLGGAENISAAERILIEQAAKKWLLVESIGNYLLGLQQVTRTTTDKNGSQDTHVLSLVIQHDRLQATLAMLLDKIGIQNRARVVPTIRERAGLAR
jgi:hypothetical protein